MIKVSIEVGAGASSACVAVRAESIRRAPSLMGELYPDSSLRVKFPIEPEGFFVKGSPPR